MPIEVIKEISPKRGISTVIARTSEKYLSFDVGQLRFVDSMNFLAISIEKLSEILEKSNVYEYTKKYMLRDKHNLITRKLIFPYEWLYSYDKLNKSRFPEIGQFYSHLKLKNITDQKYQEIIKTFDDLNCKTLGQYVEFYNKMDVLILADAMLNFIETLYREFKLDPANYISSPGTSWKAALKMSGIKLQYIKDHNMRNMIEKGIRGRLFSLGSLYHAEVKDQSKESITYIDANNLYGFIMMYKLPIKKHPKFEILRTIKLSSNKTKLI
jgi:hypothetical protein